METQEEQETEVSEEKEVKGQDDVFGNGFGLSFDIEPFEFNWDI